MPVPSAAALPSEPPAGPLALASTAEGLPDGSAVALPDAVAGPLGDAAEDPVDDPGVEEALDDEPLAVGRSAVGAALEEPPEQAPSTRQSTPTAAAAVRGR